MDINVTGRKMSVGEALTEHVEERILAIVEKYFSRSINAAVTFSKENHLVRADVSLHPNQGISLQARGENDDAYTAFESAAERVEKQLRRYKRRLKNHHAVPGRDIATELGREQIIQHHNGFDHDDHIEEDSGEDQPIIIAENSHSIPKVSVSDAVMLMDLADTPTFMFRNSKNDRLEVVYKRDDGNIGWISPNQ